MPSWRIGEVIAKAATREVRCYDTSLLIDDLHLEDDGEAVALIQAEAQFGYDNAYAGR